MIKEHIKRLNVISAILAIAGLVLMFSSVSFGTSLGDSWLSNQMGGEAAASKYNLIVKTFINNFVILVGILFGAGILTAIFTNFASLLFGKNGQ